MVDDIERISYGFGVASLVFAIMGVLMFFLPFIGIILSIIAVVLYFIQKKVAVTMASVAGLFLGIAGIIINVIALIIFVSGLVFFSAVNDEPDVIVNPPAENVTGSGVVNNNNFAMESFPFEIENPNNIWDTSYFT